MIKSLNLKRILGILSLVFALTLFLAPDIVEAKRGGSFGRSRRSFSSPKKSTSPQRKATTPQKKGSSFNSKTNTRQPSFGGTRLSSSKQYTSKYGAPRKTETRSVTSANGTKQNYIVNSYGGYGSSLMTGYMMGSVASWMMWAPWHGAFYYSRPYYAANPDGTTSVYPPTFNWSKVIMLLIVVAVLYFIIRKLVFNKKKPSYSQSSFG